MNYDRARKGKPCRICGAERWPCSYDLRKGIAFCQNVQSDKMDSRRETYMHFDVQRSYSPPVVVKADRPPAARSASAAHRHTVYSALLARLPLSKHRRQNLLGRGLTPEIIEQNGYRNTPTREESDALAQSLAHLGLEGVPGFFFMRGAWRLRWCEPAGFFCPYRDFDGHIRGMMWRFDVPVEKQKYRWLSSNPEDTNKAGNIKFPRGTSSKAPLHFACPELINLSPIGDIWLTEGSLKADVAAHLLNVPFIASGGVTQWGQDFAERFKRKFPHHRAVVAYDRDFQTNKDVNRALETLVAQFVEARVPYVIRTWSRPEKGIDDLALALSKRERRAAA